MFGRQSQLRLTLSLLEENKDFQPSETIFKTTVISGKRNMLRALSTWDKHEANDNKI